MAEAKTSQAVLDQVKFSYLAGEFTSIKELAENYSIHPKTLQSRIVRESWLEQRESKLRQVESKLVKKSVNVWVEKVKERSEKDWNIIDRSIDNIGSEVDPDTMLTSVKARKILDDMVRRSYGLTDSLDIKSGGQSIGESLIGAIEKLRQNDKAPKLDDADLGRILDAEIVDEKPENGV